MANKQIKKFGRSKGTCCAHQHACLAQCAGLCVKTAGATGRVRNILTFLVLVASSWRDLSCLANMLVAAWLACGRAKQDSDPGTQGRRW